MNDKRLPIILTIICAVLIAIATVYAVLTAAESVPEGVPPEVNTEGLCVHEPVYKMYFTDADVVAVAKMLYGESRGCSIDNQQKAVWCVLNRVDADGTVRHTAVLQDIKSKALVYCRLQDVQGKI